MGMAVLSCASLAAAQPAPPTVSPPVAAPTTPTTPATPSGSTAATPSTTDEARAHFKRGVELYQEGAFPGALAEFRRAYDLAPNPKVLFNIGQVYYQQRDYANALPYFERYLAESGAELAGKQRTDLEQEVVRLRSRIATVTLAVTPPGASIEIDDESVGSAPLAKPVSLSAGRHKIAVSKAGFVSTTKSIEVVGGDAAKVDISLAEQLAVVAPDARGTAPRAGGGDTSSATGSQRPSAVWVGWGITGALTTGAIVTGALALGASHDLADRRNALNATRAQVDTAYDHERALSITSDALGAAALIAGAVSLYFTLRHRPETTPNTGVAIGLTPQGAWARARF